MAINVGIVGAGIAGVHLGLCLRRHDVPATIYTDRAAGEVRAGRLLNTASFGGSTRQRERLLGVNHWDTHDFQVFCIYVDIAGQPPVRFRGDLSRPNLFVDMRDYLPRLLEDFEARGGRVVTRPVDRAGLATLSKDHACVVVATGRAGLADTFERIPERCPFQEPQRRVCASLCRGIRPAEPLGMATQVVPGQGEILDFPFLRRGARVSGIAIEAVPGGALEGITRLRYDENPSRFDAALLALLREHAPLTYSRVDPADFGVLGALDLLQGAITPTVRRGYAPLGNGRFALALGDAHITHDPIGGQGANAASHAAWVLGDRIADRVRAGGTVDEAFCAGAEQTLWQETQAATEWSNELLKPASPRLAELMLAASRDQDIANDFADSYTDNPKRQLERLALA